MALNEAELRARLDEEVENLRQQLKDKDSQLKAYRKEHGQLASLLRSIEGAIQAPDPLPLAYAPKTAESGVSSVCAAVGHSTDGHHGMVQPADEIEGFGEFSPAISVKRQLGYASGLVEWVEIQRHGYRIDDFHHVVTGDMVSGDIHGDLRVTNAWPLPVQAIKAGALLANMDAFFAAHFRNVVVEFLVADNHGRLTDKPQAKEEGLNSINYVVGWYAKALLAKHTNVTFNIYPVHETVIRVLNRQYLIAHGHSVRGWMGLPYYGIERKVARESMARLQIIMGDASKAQKIGFHKYLFGHWHVPINMPLYTASGSVSGTDALDHQQGRHADPSQSAWLVHPKWGEFNRTDFDLRRFG